ncbi:MAG: EF-hand domain-containing protein [Luteimonas sp.]
MQRNAMFIATALVVASFGIAALASAQTAAPAKTQRMSLDANRDGAIDRSEAARMPRLAEKFDQLDRNGDGRLDKGERPQHHGKGKHGGRHGGIAKLDTDKDGRISRTEAAASPRGKGKLVEQFAAIDANNDGYLVRAELRAHHERMRPQREAERTQRFNARFAEADLNRDGRLSRVEVAEKMPRLAGRFAWMDDNKDGFLSREELRMQRGRR